MIGSEVHGYFIRQVLLDLVEITTHCDRSRLDGDCNTVLACIKPHAREQNSDRALRTTDHCQPCAAITCAKASALELALLDLFHLLTYRNCLDLNAKHVVGDNNPAQLILQPRGSLSAT